MLQHADSEQVNKNILDPGDFERFINFIVPNSSKYLWFGCSAFSDFW